MFVAAIDPNRAAPESALAVVCLALSLHHYLTRVPHTPLINRAIACKVDQRKLGFEIRIMRACKDAVPACPLSEGGDKAGQCPTGSLVVNVGIRTFHC